MQVFMDFLLTFYLGLTNVDKNTLLYIITSKKCNVIFFHIYINNK